MWLPTGAALWACLPSHTRMSLERELTTKVFHPLRRARFWDRGLRIPILTYHSISNDAQPDLPPAARTATDPFTFRQQMRFLITAGCNPVDLSQLVGWLRDGVRPPDKTVILTFDNGLRDFYTNAFPVLQEQSFPATVFSQRNISEHRAAGWARANV